MIDRAGHKLSHSFIQFSYGAKKSNTLYKRRVPPMFVEFLLLVLGLYLL